MQITFCDQSPDPEWPEFETACSGGHGSSSAGAVWTLAAHDFHAYMYKAEYYDAIESGAVTAFNSPACEENSGAFFASSDVNQKAYYTRNDLVEGHMTDEGYSVVNYLMVPYGYAAEVFAEDNF